MGKVFILRHGETDFNAQRRYLGQTDISLNSTGIDQMRKLKNYVKNLDVDFIISSPFKRTLESAQIIGGRKTIFLNSAFVERSVGVYEGLTRREAKEKYPDLFAQDITRIFDKAPTGGETIIQVQNRVFSALDKIKKKYPNKNILIVTHAFVGRVINKYFNPQISNEEFFKFVLSNAEIKEYEFYKLS